ncbi:MAG: PAS domain S-box protein [Chitinivibrionales bacterium]|nr:PAS domain S-box protein [Chitinivibrionales bacterium]
MKKAASKKELLEEINEQRRKIEVLEDADHERRRIQKLYQALETRWKLLLCDLPNIIMTVSSDGTILAVNRIVNNISVGDAVGASMYEIVQPVHHSELQNAIHATFAGSKSHTCTIAGTSGNNDTIIWYEMKTTPVWRDNQVIAVTLNLLDITDKIGAKEALTETEANLHAILSSMVDMVFAFDKNGKFTFCHTADMLQLYVAPEEFIGRSFCDIMPEYMHESMRTAFARNRDGRTFAFEYELEIGGEMKNFYAKLSPIRINNRFCGSVAVVREISDIKRVAAERARNERIESMGIFITGVIADLKKLFAGILSYSSYALEHGNPNGMVRECLEKSMQAYDRATAYIRELISFSNTHIPSKKTIDPEKFIHETMAQLARETGIGYTITVAPGLSPLAVDIHQMQKVIENITKNSREAMPEGGTIEIRVGNHTLDRGNHYGLEPGSYVVLAFIDKGTGMSRKNIDKVFDPFFTTKNTGSGLGLSLCYAIIRNHNGHIGIISGPDTGTKVTIYLPAG